MNPPTSATNKAWSKGHCAVGMSISIVSPDFKEGNCSTPRTKGSIFSPASSARQATTKSFNETSRTPAFFTWVCKRDLLFATVRAAGSEASSAMMPQLSRAAEKASLSLVLESMPRTKAALSEKCVERALARAGTKALPTSEAPLPCTAHKATGTGPERGVDRSRNEPALRVILSTAAQRFGNNEADSETSVRKRLAWTTQVLWSVVSQSFRSLGSSPYSFLPSASSVRYQAGFSS
mmetsp:Transcript_6415/g.19038  ORF Transcript_6415/g.19038 Transcript_6415/m.19038 type:complete len:236 (+) Transcript_6415:35-742(+)